MNGISNTCITPYSRTHKVSGRVQNLYATRISCHHCKNQLMEYNDAYEMENLVDNIKLNLYNTKLARCPRLQVRRYQRG